MSEAHRLEAVPLFVQGLRKQRHFLPLEGRLGEAPLAISSSFHAAMGQWPASSGQLCIPGYLAAL